jgi:hypothetical protein
MNPSSQIAKHFREVHFGGNWTASNLKEALTGITWQQATAQVYSFNTIAALTYHINYYVSAVLKVLQGEALSGSDKYSFDHPPILSADDWQGLLDRLSLKRKALRVWLNNCKRRSSRKSFGMRNMEIITGIFTGLLNIRIITLAKLC